MPNTRQSPQVHIATLQVFCVLIIKLCACIGLGFIASKYQVRGLFQAHQDIAKFTQYHWFRER